MTRYVLEFFSRILDLDHDNSYTLLIRPQGIKDVAAKLNISQLEIEELTKNLKIKIKNLCLQVLDIPHYSLGEQTKLLSYLNKERFDLVHFIQFNHPLFYKGKFVTTIHDLTLIGHLHYFNFARQLAFNLVMRDAAKRSERIIAISKVTRQDIIDYYAIPKGKFAVIYLGIDHHRYNEQVKSQKTKIQSFKEKYGISRDYLLYTGMWKKHKNLLRLFKAFEQFLISQRSAVSGQQSGAKTPNLQLVLTGKIDKNEPEVIAEINRINKRLSGVRSQELGAKGNLQNLPQTPYLQPLTPSIVTTGFIDEEELPLAYAGALAYVIPSLSEGFGLPPLESMACGTPVIASKESCMPEIEGDAPLYFDPYNEKDIEKAIERIVGDENLRVELAKKGIIQAQKYQWEKTARETLAVYQNILNK